MYEYNATVERIVDGDTVDLNIDLGFDVWMKTRARLYGIDTPESRTRNLREKVFGKRATARVNALIPVGSTVRILVNDRGKFGRPLTVIMYGDSLTDLNDQLVVERLAVRYHGQSKSDISVEHEANWDFLDVQSDARE